MNRSLPIVALACVFALAAVLGGCSSDDAGGTDTPAAGTAANAGGTSGGGSGAPSGNIVNDPGQAQPGQPVKIEPANPSDPKYQPDPNLGGG